MTILVLASWGTDGAIAAPFGTFQAVGAVARPGTWSVARVRRDLKADARTVRYTLKGKAHTAQRVPLRAPIAAAQPRINPRIKHHVLPFVVVAQEQDGYAATFTLAEMLPEFGHEAVWVALNQDGTSLPAELPADDGPVERLLPGDTKAARWVHGVSAIMVVDKARALPAGR